MGSPLFTSFSPLPPSAVSCLAAADPSSPTHLPLLRPPDVSLLRTPALSHPEPDHTTKLQPNSLTIDHASSLFAHDMFGSSGPSEPAPLDDAAAAHMSKGVGFLGTSPNITFSLPPTALSFFRMVIGGDPICTRASMR